MCLFALFKFLFLPLSCSYKQCLIKILNVMEKYYLCSVQSKTNPSQNETVLVLVDEISEFVSTTLSPDCVLIISSCSTFKEIPNEK